MKRHTAHRSAALIAIFGLAACSGNGESSTSLPLQPIATSTAPGSTTSATTRATFTIHWTTTAKEQSSKRRDTISASTQSIGVSVNGGVATVVNKPTVSGSPSSSTVSIPAAPGSDSFVFTAWDQVNGSGNILDQATTTQDIIANANNAVSVALDGVCAALVPSLSATSIYAETTTFTATLASGTRTILKSARLVGNIPQLIAFTPVDADGNTILAGSTSIPITVTESGQTPHVAIAPNAAGTANTVFKITPIVGEPDGFSTQLTASSQNCGPGSATLPNSLAISTSSAIYTLTDSTGAVYAFDQDGTALAKLATVSNAQAIAYNSNSNYLVVLGANTANQQGLFTFQTLSPTGTALGSGYFTPTGYGTPNTYDVPPSPSSAAYNSTNGFFVVSFFEGEDKNVNTIIGGVQNFSISGSTIANEPSNFSGKDPYAVAVVGNGDVVVSDLGSDYIYLDAPNGTTLGLEGSQSFALAVDSLRGNVLAQNALYDSGTESTSYPGAVFPYTQDLTQTGTFAVPAQGDLVEQEYSALAYSRGNDELYLFGRAQSEAPLNSGMPGSAIYSGGSSASNLAPGAFSSIEIDRAVVVP